MCLFGGQTQHTTAARMFIRQPELLVFDDLSSALNVETESLRWERFSPVNTCLVRSHCRTVLRQADRILVLKDGRQMAVERVARKLQTISPDRVEALSLRLFGGLEVAEESQSKLRSGELILWLNFLERDYDNLRGALEWLLK
ncbi:MAG: hypothetical protein WAM60_14015, partial [Candidatus Promineifilaceae bacterium]